MKINKKNDIKIQLEYPQNQLRRPLTACNYKLKVFGQGVMKLWLMQNPCPWEPLGAFPNQTHPSFQQCTDTMQQESLSCHNIMVSIFFVTGFLISDTWIAFALASLAASASAAIARWDFQSNVARRDYIFDQMLPVHNIFQYNFACREYFLN